MSDYLIIKLLVMVPIIGFIWWHFESASGWLSLKYYSSNAVCNGTTKKFRRPLMRRRSHGRLVRRSLHVGTDEAGLYLTAHWLVWPATGKLFIPWKDIQIEDPDPENSKVDLYIPRVDVEIRVSRVLAKQLNVMNLRR